MQSNTNQSEEEKHYLKETKHRNDSKEETLPKWYKVSNRTNSRYTCKTWHHWSGQGGASRETYRHKATRNRWKQSRGIRAGGDTQGKCRSTNTHSKSKNNQQNFLASRHNLTRGFVTPCLLCNETDRGSVSKMSLLETTSVLMSRWWSDNKLSVGPQFWRQQ